MDKKELQILAGQIIDLQKKLKNNPKDYTTMKEIQTILSKLSFPEVLQINDIVDQYFKNV